VTDLVEFLWVILGVLALAYVVAGWEIHSRLLGLREKATAADQGYRKERKP
jgi:hypothetical protein